MSRQPAPVHSARTHACRRDDSTPTSSRRGSLTADRRELPARAGSQDRRDRSICVTFFRSARGASLTRDDPSCIRAACPVRPLPGAASDRCWRARSRVPHLRADARPAGGRQGRSGSTSRPSRRRRSPTSCRARPRPASSIPRSSSRSPPASRARVAYRAEEYVAAESLDVAMRHYAPAAIDKALPFITQLAGAIDFARAAGVGHGALHPRDIFVTPDEARATGFGVVEALERVGLRAPVRRPYSAPERIAGGAWRTPADVFSLAAIAYELLTGRRPAGHGRRDRRADAGGADRRTPAAARRARARDGRAIRRAAIRPRSRSRRRSKPPAHGKAASETAQPPRRAHQSRLRSRAGAASRLGSCTGRRIPPPRCRRRS